MPKEESYRGGNGHQRPEIRAASVGLIVVRTLGKLDRP